MGKRGYRLLNIVIFGFILLMSIIAIKNFVVVTEHMPDDEAPPNTVTIRNDDLESTNIAMEEGNEFSAYLTYLEKYYLKEFGEFKMSNKGNSIVIEYYCEFADDKYSILITGLNVLDESYDIYNDSGHINEIQIITENRDEIIVLSNNDEKN